MEPCYSTQLRRQHLEHEKFRALQWQFLKARVENLGEELAKTLSCRSQPDFLSPWCSTSTSTSTSTTSSHDPTKPGKGNTVLIWIRLPLLGPEYCGFDCLSKIVRVIGKAKEVDYGHALKEGLKYARILIEVEEGKDLPKFILVRNHKGEEILLHIQYEYSEVK